MRHMISFNNFATLPPVENRALAATRERRSRCPIELRLSEYIYTARYCVGIRHFSSCFVDRCATRDWAIRLTAYSQWERQQCNGKATNKATQTAITKYIAMSKKATIAMEVFSSVRNSRNVRNLFRYS